MSSRTRILIADDHIMVAELCKSLLLSEHEVVGIVNNGHAMIRAAAQLKPDVIIVDVAMPVLNGLDAGQKVREIDPAIKLIFLTMNSDPELAAEALRCGGSGYLLKTCAYSELVVAIREVLRGTLYISRMLAKKNVHNLRPQDNGRVKVRETLTARQREVLQLLAEGKAMKEVGAALNMTKATVAFHKYRIMEAIGAKNNAEMVRYAVRNHMIAA